MSLPATTADLHAPAAGSSTAPRLAQRVLGFLGGSLLKKSALSVFDQALVSGTSFLTSVILGRLCTQTDLGAYYLALAIVFFVRGIQEQLVSAPYTIYCSRRTGRELAAYAGSSLIHQAIVMAVTCAALAALAPWGVFPEALDRALWLLVATAPLLLFREYLRQLLFAHLNLGGAILLDGAVALVQLIGLGSLALAGQLTISTTLLVLGLAAALPAAAWMLVSRGEMTLGLPAAWKDFRHNWTFARWALASQLLACSAPYVLPWVVALTHGEAQTGTLGACTTLVGLSNMFLMGLCNFLSPKAARAYVEGGLVQLRRVLWQTGLLFVASLGSICIGAFLFGESVAMLVYGPEFAGTGLVIGVLSLSTLANSLGVTAGNGLWAMERPSANFVADLCALGVVVLATIVLVPMWGPLGAAVATLCGTGTDAAVRLLILRMTMRELAQVEATA
jgi:O-antigen/teichoic acid export membrane protein